MLSEAETYKEIEDRCWTSKTDSQAYPMPQHQCSIVLERPECGSLLLEAMTGDYAESEYKCRVCGEKATIATMMPLALKAAYAGAIDEAVKDGGVEPIGRCPTCGEVAFTLEMTSAWSAAKVVHTTTAIDAKLSRLR